MVECMELVVDMILSHVNMSHVERDRVEVVVVAAAAVMGTMYDVALCGVRAEAVAVVVSLILSVFDAPILLMQLFLMGNSYSVRTSTEHLALNRCTSVAVIDWLCTKQERAMAVLEVARTAERMARTVEETARTVVGTVCTVVETVCTVEETVCIVTSAAEVCMERCVEDTMYFSSDLVHSVSLDVTLTVDSN